jgi:hypothetical protein
LDKYEYKVRADEIKALIAEGEYAEAVEIADTIDWRRVRSVMMLCTVSDLYKANRRYQESKDILLMAYEKHPTGRAIVYSLCELSIKMGEYVQALEYYKEFVQIAPQDTGRYILQYRLYEAQDVSLEERIAVLEEYKKHDYSKERWAYELAYLYHRIGLATKCVEECDEMYLWFGTSKYVIKALELKMLHEPLNADQQASYDAWLQKKNAPEEEETVSDSREDEAEENNVSGDTQVAAEIGHTPDEELPGGEDMIPDAPTMELPEVKTVDVGQYNTINLQMALAESMREIMDEETQEAPPEEAATSTDETTDDGAYADENAAAAGNDTDDDTEIEDIEDISEEEMTDVSEIEADPAEGADEPEEDSIAKALIAPLLQETAKIPAEEVAEDTAEEAVEDIAAEAAEETAGTTAAESSIVQFPSGMADKEETQAEDVSEAVQAEDEPIAQAAAAAGAQTDEIQEIGSEAPLDTSAFDAQKIMQEIRQEMVKPSSYDNILSQDYDGQISLVMPEAERVEKQITGQLSIDDIMAEWEEMKKNNEKKRREDVRKRILDQTGSMFADFDEATKNGLLEKLEKAFMEAIMEESKKSEPGIKKVILPDDNTDPEQTSGKPLMEAAPEPVQQETAQEDDLPAEEDPDGVEELEEIEEPTDDADSKEERELTSEEQNLFGQFVHHKKAKKQLVNTLDNMSLAACTGNVVITGEEGITTLTLAKALIREMQYNDNNFSGKVAKITGSVLNKKDIAATFGKLDNGALIIEKAAALKPDTVEKMIKVLEKDNMGLLLLMTGTKKEMDKLTAEHAALLNNFNLRVDIEPLDDESLVAYAKQYAEEMEYSIDEFGILALHTRISEKQTSDHEVTLAEVRELVDEAIHYANKKTPGHLMDILFAKRYDGEDMIILREKDFMHYK